MGYTRDAIAVSHNINAPTTAAQIRSIYTRTRCGNRVELLRLIVKITPPFKH